MYSLTWRPLTLVEKMFTRKLHVPTKHVVRLTDPCESPSPLTMKHLYVALLKIIQTDVIVKEDQDRMKETIRKIEKSAAGNENIITATIEWLTYMDPKHPPSTSDNEIAIACRLIDWAIGTTICREDLESNIEKLRILKSENANTLKTLRTGNFPLFNWHFNF
jgi:hypothetical protein